MPKDNQSDPRKGLAPRYLPWLLGAGMFVVYWCTLNPWVNLQNVNQVAAVAGWEWEPQIYNPLTFLVTLPFRLLSAAKIPVAINVFSALCAAVALGLLARCVAILPHDRTEMERTRERSDFGFLTGWVAWIPPVVAVVFAGLQLGFWENATSFTHESFQLLWFAIILWQLLEYRLDENETRLFVAALLFGAGMAENWAMVCFFPVFMTMIIWLRKLEFFNVNFLSGLFFSGLAGTLLFFLLPLHAKFTAPYPMTIWEALRPNLQYDWQVVHLISNGDVCKNMGLMFLTSLFPAFVMCIRWSATFGDSSRMGATLVNYMMHGVNAVLFGVLLWASFDPPFSARRLSEGVMSQVPALTLYYVAALSIGYYCGYALLIFGKPPIPTRRNVTPEPALPPPLLWLCPIIVAVALVVTTLLAGLLIYKNAPALRALNGDSLSKYAAYTIQNLPPDGAIVLSDNDRGDNGQAQPTRTYLVQAALAREGRLKDYVVVDTRSLTWVPYHNFLHHRFPNIWPHLVTTNDLMGLTPPGVLHVLDGLSKSNQLCYLNPSFGDFFEEFYQEPHGLVYTLKPLPADTLVPPPLSSNLIAENDAFWQQLLSSARPAIQAALNPRDLTKKPGVIGKIMKRVHAKPEADPNSIMAGEIYSRALNSLGVQFQRADARDQAATLFSEAYELNSNNVVASMNLDFNKNLRDGKSVRLDPAKVTTDQFGKFRNMNEVLDACGPYDEPSYCFYQGCNFMDIGMWRQAAASFIRVRQLEPDNLATRFFLAEIYLTFQLPDRAIDALREPLADGKEFALTGNDPNSVELNVLAATAHFQKNENAEGARLLQEQIDRQPDNDRLLFMAAQAFYRRGLYTNALHVINLKLSRTPNDPQWLDGKGIVSTEAGAYDDAVTALTHYLQIETNDAPARFYRGFANFQGGHLDAARADLLQLQATYTNDFHLAYGLGEIAWREHSTNEAVRNYQIYLANAPTNAVEINAVRDHLTQLHGK